ncbi:MAG: sugar phosphate isomerase/epimerase [Candidatus Bathyarchaeota archaeon]|nr:sugar phosphate isomerase/epimerase [Candidatus Bathyarchaeota archaeon]MDH5778984.1 sugar phosphate isomerase/epimerase [Candidatus Bathyarchaeota archaeon]
MPNVKIGLSMLFCLGESFKSLVRRLRKVDVNHVELLDEGLHSLNSNRVKTLKKLSLSHGLELSLHAPFVDMNIASPNPIFRRTILRHLRKSIRYASQLNCQFWVFHPGKRTGVSRFYPGLDWELNIGAVHELSKTAKQHGVPIAVENLPESFPFLMKSVEDFSRFYNDFQEDLGLAFDIGHANMNKQIEDFVTRFSSKIVHIHAHDNEGIQDSHLGIGNGNIPWTKVADVVKKSKYHGTIMLESVDHVRESLQTVRKLFT